MVEYINNRVCVGLQELEGIVSSTAMKVMTHRGTVQKARRACRDTSALYYLDSLPYKYRCEVYKRYPDLNAQKEAKPWIESIEPDGEAINFFEEYTFADGSHLTPTKIELYSNDAAILRAFGDRMARSNAERIKTGHSRCVKSKFWESATKALPRIADRYPNTLPDSPRRLQEKYNKFLREGYAGLISGKHGNGNAAKVDTDEKKAVINALCALPNGFDNEFVAKCYNETAEKLRWGTITAGTVAKYRKENSLYIDALRHGNNHFNNTKSMQVARRRPEAAMLMWSLDGWDAELFYQKRNTKGVVTYSNRKVLEVVIDPCCDFIIGYAIGDKENSELIAAALRDAANYTRELFGQRYRTCQLQSDHFAKSAMAPYYATVAEKVTPARVGNAKSKPIERFFAYLNTTYCKRYGNWGGYGITGAKKNKANPDWLNANKKEFPDEAGVIAQIEAVIAEDRAAKMDEYLKLWAATPQERRLPLGDEAFLLRFGRTTGNTNVLEGSGVRPRIGGHRYQYDSFDIRFRELSYLRWELRYDESDMSRVLAVSEDGKHRFMLQEKYIQPMALAERGEGDAEELARTRAFNKELIDTIDTRMQQTIECASKVIRGLTGKRTESLDSHNALAGILITDSKGQHKEQRASERDRINDHAEDAVEIAAEEPKERRRKKIPVPVEIVGEDSYTEERINTFDLF